MKFLIVLLLFVLCSQDFSAAEQSCITEFRSAYSSFLARLMREKESHKGSYLKVIMEKTYRKKTADIDTVQYIFSPPKRVKMSNNSFTFHSDGNNYVVIIPALKKIGIQKIAQQKGADVANPIEQMKEMAEAIISDKNYLRCQEFTDTKNKKYKELVLKSPGVDSKYSAIETIHYVMDMSSRSILSVAIYYTEKAEVKQEKYTFTSVNMDYLLPQDLLCPLEETIMDSDKHLRKEYSGYNLTDMRKQKQIQHQLK